MVYLGMLTSLKCQQNNKVLKQNHKTQCELSSKSSALKQHELMNSTLMRKVMKGRYLLYKNKTNLFNTCVLTLVEISQYSWMWHALKQCERNETSLVWNSDEEASNKSGIFDFLE